MNILAQTLGSHFPFSELTPQHKEQVEYACLSYLFRVISSRDLTRVLRQHFGNRPVAEFRTKMFGNGYILQKLKPYLFELWKKGHRSKVRQFRLASRYGVERQDVVLSGHLDKMAPKLRKYSHKFVAPSGPTAMTAFIDEQYPELLTFCRKFVYKKMSFIISSTGLTVDDLSYECLSKGVQGLYLMYPCYLSKLHALNIMKRTIHNHGMNIINQYTTSSRQTLRLAADGSTFESMKLPLHALPNGVLGNKQATQDMFMSSMDGTSDWSSFRDVNTKVENAMDCSLILNKFKGKKQRFLTLLTGELDEKFSVFIREEHGIKISNDNWMNRCLSRGNVEPYIQASAEYVGVKPEQGIRFVKRLRRELNQRKAA